MKVKEITKRRRFLKLLKKFRELPEDRFDIRSWVDTLPTWLPSNFLTKRNCGTTGCLAGWTVAWFPRCWEYNCEGYPTLRSLRHDWKQTVAFNMSEFFGGIESDWARIIYGIEYSHEKEYREKGYVPKHLVMKRLTKLYTKLYRK